MKNIYALIAVAVMLSLTGCQQPNTGAYEATIVLPNGQAKLMGIAIIKQDAIIADGESVKVHEWVEDENRLTARAEDGSQIFELIRTGDGEFTQEIPAGKLVFKKYSLPTSPVTW